jgi:hypothetical protein
MWLWGALPLRPPSHEPAGTCRVAWDALPLLPQAISASYFFRGRHVMAADPAPFPDIGKAASRWGQATDSGPSPELGKADTRSGEGPESVACSSRHLSKFSAEPENLHGARSAHRIWCRVQHESRPRFRRTGVPPSVIVAVPDRLHAPCGFSGPGENPRRRG